MMKWPIFGGFGSYSLKYWLILPEFWLEVVSNKTNTVFEKSIEILHFGSNATHLNFTVLVYFWAQFTTGETKNITKNQNFCKTYILRNTKYQKSQVPEKWQNFCKIKQKNKQFFFGSKLDLNCPLGQRKRVIRNSHIAYNRAVQSVYTFWIEGFKFWVFVVFYFTWKKRNN